MQNCTIPGLHDTKHVSKPGSDQAINILCISEITGLNGLEQYQVIHDEKSNGLIFYHQYYIFDMVCMRKHVDRLCFYQPVFF